jgi:NAD+ kinase
VSAGAERDHDRDAAPRLRAVGILARPDLREAGGLLRELCAFLRARRVGVCLEERTAELVDGRLAAGVEIVPERELAARVDLVVVLGGDGTLLGASRLIEPAVPVLAVNFGSLGFLTEVALSELYPSLEAALEGSCEHEERRLLRAQVRRDGRDLVLDDVLNDVVVTKTATSRLLDLEVAIDGRFVSSFRADGLIVSSPTGSTAYNLSAGGPILHPLVPALVVTPICPHMLSHRPLVVLDRCVVEVRVRPGPPLAARVDFDGQRGLELLPGDTLTVTRSPRVLRLVKAPARDYFEVLRTKLKWGEPTTRRS